MSHTSSHPVSEAATNLVDLVEEVEGRRVALLYGEDERERHQRLLPAGQLVHLAHVALAAGEGDLDADARELVGVRALGSGENKGCVADV